MPCFRARRFERKNWVSAPSVAPIDRHDQCQERHVMELENKTIIVTGASSGIGAAAAKLFASEGANVVLGARRGAELEALADAIGQANGRATFLAGDVKDDGYAAALVDHAIKAFGGLDGAFNNAGMVGEMPPVTDMDIGNWTDVISVTLTGAFLAAQRSDGNTS